MALFVKKHFPTILKSTASFKAKNYKQALIDAFLEVDRRLESPEGRKELEAINKAIPHKSSPVVGEENVAELANYVGCTACVALVTKTEMYIANAGDSRCVLSKNGIGINMSEDHKPDLEKEKKRIEAAGGTVEDNRVNGVINLSRSLGDLDYKMNKSKKPEEQIITAFPDVKVEKIANETEFLVIACDGVWDCMSSQDAVDFVKDAMTKTAFKPDKTYKLSKIIEAMFEKIIAPTVEANGNIALYNYRRTRMR